MTDVRMTVQTALSKQTQEVILLLNVQWNSQSKSYEFRTEVIERFITNLIQTFAEPHNGEEVSISLGDDSYPMLPQFAMTLALRLLCAAESVKTENVYKRFMSEQVGMSDEETLIAVRQFREFSARMAEDQFHRLE